MSSTFNNPPNGKLFSTAPVSVDSPKARSLPDLKRQLDLVWKQSRPIIVDRFNRLDAYVLAVEAGISTPQQHEDAVTIAHTFAGSLGMFGYVGGTELARSMEQWLDATPRPDPVTLKEFVAALHAMLDL